MASDSDKTLTNPDLVASLGTEQKKGSCRESG